MCLGDLRAGDPAEAAEPGLQLSPFEALALIIASRIGRSVEVLQVSTTQLVSLSRDGFMCVVCLVKIVTEAGNSCFHTIWQFGAQRY